MLYGVKGHSVVNGSAFLPPINLQLQDKVNWGNEGDVTSVKNQVSGQRPSLTD